MDLNLLVAFDAVMRERNVTRAGEAIGLSQPAVSNALARLRHHLKDDLFIRARGGMLATPRAMELAEPVRDILNRLETVLDPSAFDPATDARVFRIIATEFFTPVMLPLLTRHLALHAPHVDLRMLPTTGRTLETLDAGEADFAISVFPELPDRFDSFVLVDDEYIVLMRKDHPLASGPISLKDFATFQHILVSRSGDGHGFVDTELERHGLSRRVGLTISHFTAAPPLLAQSDMMLTIPKRLAEVFAEKHGLIARPAPVPGPPQFSCASLIWHKRLATHPAQIWLRETLAELMPLNVKAESGPPKK